MKKYFVFVALAISSLTRTDAHRTTNNMDIRGSFMQELGSDSKTFEPDSNIMDMVSRILSFDNPDLESSKRPRSFRFER
ncbi:Oidioi.mRNA.OKI2018_I69.chr2.g6320.t1.cds [Oikopleura dioica]|uniref:Oidioi.mRNA.OKI2018_I69.chr2.g6320.t1.cds n=1 Tax=Oikopleura dioica TaxID=34765 RepID=A0ABN7T6A3_OIKDI|nr:Oidioi.mRNA.OKI2018_I69.chr2.g6320.t1.cds [Oikopleura dioica]